MSGERVKIIDKAVSTNGDDIVLSMRLEGAFHANFELHAFPFDIQTLDVCVAINCRTTGAMPVSLTVDPMVVAGVDVEGVHH